MAEHHLKTWPEPFQAVWDGTKKAELRQNDRDYRVGDVLVLKEWVPDLDTVGTPDGIRGTYSGRFITARSTHIIMGGRLGLAEGYCVISIHVTWCADASQLDPYPEVDIPK